MVPWTNLKGGGGEFPVETARYVVAHSGTMEDGQVPVFAGHLLLCDVGAGNLDESAPGAFDKTVYAMSFYGGYNDIVLVVVDP